MPHSRVVQGDAGPLEVPLQGGAPAGGCSHFAVPKEVHDLMHRLHFSPEEVHPQLASLFSTRHTKPTVRFAMLCEWVQYMHCPQFLPEEVRPQLASLFSLSMTPYNQACSAL